MAVNGHGIRRSPSSSSSEGNSNNSNNNNGAAPITTTGLAAAPTTKKRHRGRSLRSNVLLRPRRLSIPLPPPLPPQPQPQPDDSESEEEFSSSDYSSDEEADDNIDDDDDDDDGKGDGGVVVVEPALVEYRVLRPVAEVGDPGDTLFWGWVVLLSTWVVFVVGIGSVLGVWEWAWTGEMGSGGRKWPRSIGGEKGIPGEVPEFPIPGYYPAMGILSCVMAWVWVVVSWVGLKYFKHAKIQS
jgi:hypothetical protein